MSGNGDGCDDERKEDRGRVAFVSFMIDMGILAAVVTALAAVGLLPWATARDVDRRFDQLGGDVVRRLERIEDRVNAIDQRVTEAILRRWSTHGAP